MAGIYNADIFCDSCINGIKEDICTDLWSESFGNETPDGVAITDFESWEELDNHLRDMDESLYDSDEYPKYCSDSEESDTPQHCGGCGTFLGNDLTTYGNDYVREAVNEDLESGCTDSVAISEWMPFYDYLDYMEQCANCGDYAELNCDDECLDCECNC